MTSTGANPPPGWTSIPFGQIIGTTGLFRDGDWIESKDQDPHGDVRLIQLADIGNGYFADKSSRFLTSQKALQLGCTFLETGDVLIARMPDPLGRACIFPGTPQKSVTVVDVCVTRPDSRLVNNEWLMYAVNSPLFRREIEKKASGTTRSRISRGNLSSIEIPVPPIAEQLRIVSRIKALQLQNLRAQKALDAIPALLERFQQAVLAAAFRGDLTADWREQHPDVEPSAQLLERIRTERRHHWEETELEKMRAKGRSPQSNTWKSRYEEPQAIDTSSLPPLPHGWCWTSADHCAWEITVGHVGPMKEQYVATGVPFLRSQNVRENRFDDRELRYIPEEFHEKLSKSVLRPNDLVVVRSGAPGTACVIPSSMTEANCSDLVIVRLLKRINPHLLSYFINSEMARSRIIGLQVGVAQQHFNVGAMRGLPVPVMPESEQAVLNQRLQQIFASLDDIKKTVLALSQSQQQLESALLSKAFRGDIVPQDPNDEPISVILERIRAERESSIGSKPKRSPGRTPGA